MTTPLAPRTPRALTTAQFHTLAAVLPELEWFANLPNAHTRRAYRQDIADFMAFAGLQQPEQFRAVTRAHVIAWRDQLVRQGLANDTIRRKLAALSSLYAYLCDRHAVPQNPVLGVKRPRSMNRDGVTPALGDHQARMLLEAPLANTLKGKRDRAILATLLYHGVFCISPQKGIVRLMQLRSHSAYPRALEPLEPLIFKALCHIILSRKRPGLVILDLLPASLIHQDAPACEWHKS